MSKTDFCITGGLCRIFLRSASFYLPLLFAALLAIGASASDRDSLLGAPPGKYIILSGDRQVRIPFELFRGDILMRGEVNGREVRMMLDNGFLWDQLLFFGSPIIDSLDLNYDGEAQVSGSGSGDAVASKTASGITISFPGIKFTDQSAIITPYESGMTNMWWGTEGQVSATFLKHFVVGIDFDEMIITLTEPTTFKYKGQGLEIPLKPLLPGAWGIPAEVELMNGRTISVDLMMDLGYGDALQIDIGQANNIGVPEAAIEAILGFGVQGETRGNFGRVRSVRIGTYTLDSIITAFASVPDGAPSFHELTMGMELFSRFNVIFDYPNQRMFLEPNTRFAEPFEYNMSGLSTRKGRGDYLEITAIHPGSPAERAGLKVGDKITRLNGRPATDYDVWELRPVFRQEGAAVTLTVQREDTESEVRIVLQRLI
ncbi:MAG: PDZ domain-containing protein [Candidatus Zixiibacteriota bacterium]|nr:MAG: PDZ domain-containing protein [candidate division Zixibacteria bacterium]